MVCEGGGIRHDNFPYNGPDRFLSARFLKLVLHSHTNSRPLLRLSGNFC